jgi:Rrf2 family protein
MLISTKGRYALRVMIELMEAEDGEYVSLKKISENQKISLKYLEIIVSLLQKDKLLDSMRGKNGGYRLNKTPQNYTIGEILRTTDEGLVPVDCDCINGSEKECERERYCLTQKLWKGLGQSVNNYLDQITLYDLKTGNIDI